MGLDVSDGVDNAALPSDETKSEAALSPDWKAILWGWLEMGGKRVGIPAFVVSLAALCVIVANYRMTVAANRPDLASNGFHVELMAQPPHVVVDLENVGKKVARRGKATLLSLAQADGPAVEIGSAPIIGAGTSVIPGYGSSARFDSSSIAPAFFLVCSAYFDDSGARYEQAFMFQRSGGTARDPVLAYEELAPPDLR